MKYKEDSGIMDISERDTLSKIGDEFDNNLNDEYYNAFIKYFDFIDKYYSIEFGTQTYTDDHLIPKVFITTIKSENQINDYLRHSLYCLKLYIDFLRKYIQKDYLARYKTLRRNLLADTEWLLANYETNIKNHKEEIHLTHGSSHQLSTFDIYSVLRELTTIENANDIKDLDLRDILPYRMFVIRQLLETLGKNLIGFTSIEDNNGSPIHKFTQISWDFLNNITSNQWEISLPLNISSIHTMNKWSHSFVHANYIYASYIQYYAVEVLGKLMKPVSVPVQCHDGISRRNNLFGDFKIKGYNNLKSDFENYIKSTNKNAKVNWMPIDKVGAYIISL